MNDFGNRIRMARKHAGFTQEELAEMIGVSRIAVAKWERGEKEPKLLHLVCLSQILQVSTDTLLGLNTAPANLSDSAWLALEQFMQEVRKK